LKRKTYQSWNGIDAETVITATGRLIRPEYLRMSLETHGFMIMKRIITNRISNCIGVKKYQKTGIRILLFSIQKAKAIMKTTRKMLMADYGLLPLV
jgi:predicted amino acid dehydrogenase